MDKCVVKFDEESCEAIALADRYRAKYLDAARNRTGLSSATNLVSIGAGLAGLFYALDGRTQYQDRIRRLGTVAVGAYAINTVYAQSPLTLIYLKGVAAMECSIYVMAPSFVPKSQTVDLESNLLLLRQKIDAFGDALGPLGENITTKDLQLRGDAESLFKALERRQVEIRTAGMRASMRVHQIASEVNHQLLSGQPDANSIFSLVRSMPGLSESIGVRIPMAAKPAPAPVTKIVENDGRERFFVAKLNESFPSQAEAIRAIDAMNILLSARNALTDAMRQARATLERVTVPVLDDDEIASCAPDDAGTKLAVSPQDRSIVIEQGKTFSFLITTDGVPSASVGGKQVESIALRAIEVADGGAFKLTIEAKKPTGTEGPTVTIRSSNGWRVVEVRVTVSMPK